ncbi:hypothetical protein Patl1_29598 [Pistacia atlantica]|uniref:Uncharacterized protein n=1 Tax=Pistacia atlantica TaxID=434234 RepID=A0ACC1A8X9_9ROSI|nr:hypothetical protein Patl1_29598 [Pistacia atlantica]
MEKVGHGRCKPGSHFSAINITFIFPSILERGALENLRVDFQNICRHESTAEGNKKNPIEKSKQLAKITHSGFLQQNFWCFAPKITHYPR